MYAAAPPDRRQAVAVAAGFVEVFLAKEGHAGGVGINFLEKVQLPTPATLYGALLAGVDYVLVGAGIPRDVPGLLDGLLGHDAVSLPLHVTGSTPADDHVLTFDGSMLGVSIHTPDDDGRSVFQGSILVGHDAQKTDARQMHRALLLSPQAHADAKPELRIFADDVKCAHGATVGDLDAESLFYLRSRGVDLETARGLLIEAFVTELFEPIAAPAIRAALDARLHRWLA